MARLLPALCALALAPTGALAQGDCFPPADSREARLFADLAVPLAFGPPEAPRPETPGSVRLEVEVAYLPPIDAETRTPTVCRPGKGPESVNLLSVLPRPRAAADLPGGLRAEASWIPPVRVNGVRSNLVGLALGRVFPLGEGAATVGLRAHATVGLVRAPVTCPDAALEDPASECFQGTRSDDRYRPNIYGLEVSVGWRVGRLQPFIGGGLNLLRPRFQVQFRNRFGQLDQRRVEVNLTRGVFLAGATWAVRPGLRLTAQLYSAPQDRMTGRLVVGWTVRS